MAKASQPRKESANPAEDGRLKTGFLTTRPRWMYEVAAIVVMYLVTLAVFWPFVIEDTRFSATNDAAAARAWVNVGEEIEKIEGTTPLWNPYVFVGFPTFGSLSNHPDTWLNPVDDVVRVGKYLFGAHTLNRQIFYYFLSGVAMFLFARGVGIPIWGALLAGLAFLLNPYNISLAEAGHGSKHWTIALMPLVLLMTHRVITKRRLLEVGLFALALVSLLLSLHVQIVYYALLTSGVYVLVWLIAGLIRKRSGIWKGLGGYAAGGLLGLGLSAYLYWPLYVFQAYSIRGTAPLRAEAAATGGLDWSYATNWSLHPMELLQLIVPGLYGLGGSLPPARGLSAANILDYNLYWGWMPFTQSSLYMGILPLLLAILAVVLLWKRDGVVQWVAIASLVGIVVSFGRFLPILYGPMYYFLPFFAKFRVPSMAMVVTSVGVALLAGYGLRELLRIIREVRNNESLAKKWTKVFVVLSAITGLGVLVGLFSGSGEPWIGSFVKQGEASRYDAQTLSMLRGLRWTLFTKSLLHTSLFALVFSLVGLGALKLKVSLRMAVVSVALAAVALTAWDLAVLDSRFLHPVQTRDFLRSMEPTPAQHFLKQELTASEEPFRVFPLGTDFQDNIWMYHRIPSIGGYAAVKLRVYQDMLDYALGINQQNRMPDLKMAGMMNAEYLVVPGRLPTEYEMVFEDPTGRQHIYRNPEALPRAWFVDAVHVESDLDATMTEITAESFDPARDAWITEEPDFEIGDPEAERLAVVPSETYRPHSFDIRTRLEEPGFLVVSEIWYPQGWVATIDGEPIKVYRTDFALRGVAVPAGEHTVRFELHPPEIRLGRIISTLSLVLTLLLIGFSLWQIRRTERA